MNSTPIEFDWSSDHTLRIVLGSEISERSHQRVVAAYAALRSKQLPGLLDITPAYTTIVLTFDLVDLDVDRIEAAVRSAVQPFGGETSPSETKSRVVEIPVCYDGDCGLDLAEVAALHGISPDEVVRLHTSAAYHVYFLGFSPGFAYLGGLPAAIASPRLSTPRIRVPGGSVGIAGQQTGIYPQSTPGGWRIIGRTPLVMFDPHRNPSALLAIADRVRFIAIDQTEFARLSRQGA